MRKLRMRWQVLALIFASAISIAVHPSEARSFGVLQRGSPVSTDGQGNFFLNDGSDEDADFRPYLQRQQSGVGQQQGGFPSFPFFVMPSIRPNFLDQLQASLVNLQQQMMQQISSLANSFTPTLNNFPNNYKNTTSTSTLVNGSLVTVNETVHKVVSNGASSFFHIKVISVKPENETQPETEPETQPKTKPEISGAQQLESNEVPALELFLPNNSSSSLANVVASSDVVNSSQSTTAEPSQESSAPSTSATSTKTPVILEVSTTEATSSNP